jgi:hypothetical protein
MVESMTFQEAIQQLADIGAREGIQFSVVWDNITIKALSSHHNWNCTPAQAQVLMRTFGLLCPCDGNVAPAGIPPQELFIGTPASSGDSN